MDKETKIVKLKLDLIFKRVFGTEEHKDWLANLIANLLDIPLESIKNIEIQNTEIVPDYLNQKFSRLDFRVRVNDEIINIELQVHFEEDYAERTLYYWSKLYSEQLKIKEAYGDAEKTICINILNFNLFDCNEYYSSYKIMEESRHSILTDRFSIVFFELKKLKNARKNKPVEVWLDLINAETEGDLEMIESTTNVKDIHDIIFTIREMSADEKTRYEAQMREKAIMDERSALTNSERRGFKKGIKKGEAIGLEKGKALGLEKGKALGLEKGKALGIEEGKIQAKVKMVDNLTSNIKLDLESALKIAEITEDQYYKYKSEQK
ncbi:MAG: Rpn family recombination-promoting nuclease/putative transposase [Oscillospiraceae bacterium]|nr:Rpn family recombination-promoting nuclease/putative transposase [Oscillospiraceae bacterium]MDY3257930.1 Rpn family recombination-promoting nuclease/putative transposase [Ruminococcus callidus]